MYRPPKTKLIVALGGVLLATSASLVQAAGLGKLSVISTLGQPLSAEIDLVSLQPGEFEAIVARVASPESYGEARIEYSPLLRQVRFATARRADGRPILRVTSNAPINEPFLDMLVEVTWPSGRLVREYPILLDPPGFAEARTPPSVAAAPAAPIAPVAPAAPISSAAPVTSSVDAVAPPVAPSPASIEQQTGSVPSAKEEAARVDGTYGPVKRGDTLNKIATDLKSDTVSLEQMLVALYRENRGAFSNNNMNQLKTGQILRVPSATDAGNIVQSDARKEINVQVADWKNYREQLAGAVASGAAKPGAISNEASGKIAVAKPDKPAPVASSGDQLKIAKMEGAGGKAGSAGAKGGPQDQLNALKEEAIARENQLKEANSRVADLEKQIKDMRKLMELKSAPPAPGKVADAKAVLPVEPTPKVVEPPKASPPATSKAGDPAKPADAKRADIKTPDVLVPNAKVENAVKPADVKPTDANKPADAKPAPPKVAAKAPAPAPEPSFLDMLQENAVLIGGAIGVLAFGGLVAFIMRRRKKSDAGNSSQFHNTSSIMPSDLKPNTVTGNRAGGLVDTGNSSFLTDFDKTGPGSIDTDEVDPVAEAEVYIAYGRDAQAEEILREAMTRDKSRHEIALKLLEIYHARKSAPAFETVARELKESVGSNHPMWAKAAAMGSSIDPDNSLYGGFGQAYAATGAYAAGGVAMVAASANAEERPVAPPDLDFDLGFSDSIAEPTAASRPIDITSVNTDRPSASTMDFDLDLNSVSPAPGAAFAKSGGLDFDLALSTPSGAQTPPAAASGFDFDLSALSLDTPAHVSTPSPSMQASSAPAMNLSDLSLDLDMPGDSGGTAVATKLELAKAYIEIGDSDGAKEILTEVAREGTTAQRDEAKTLLAKL